MPSVIDWGSLGGEMEELSKKREAAQEARAAGGGGKVQFLNMKEPGTYVFRPVGRAVRFYKIFVNKRPVIVDLEDKDEAAKIIGEHFGQEVRPDLKFAMYVIDRADQNLKVLEGNFKMLEALTLWANQTGEKPGGQNGSDWTIKATGRGFGGDNPRRYQTQPLMTKPLTNDELALLESRTSEDSKDKLPKLEDLFKAIPMDKLIEKLTGDGSSGTAQAPVAASTESVAAAVSPSTKVDATNF